MIQTHLFCVFTRVFFTIGLKNNKIFNNRPVAK